MFALLLACLFDFFLSCLNFFISMNYFQIIFFISYLVSEILLNQVLAIDFTKVNNILSGTHFTSDNPYEYIQKSNFVLYSNAYEATIRDRVTLQLVWRFDVMNDSDEIKSVAIDNNENVFIAGTTQGSYYGTHIGMTAFHSSKSYSPLAIYILTIFYPLPLFLLLYLPRSDGYLCD